MYAVYNWGSVAHVHVRAYASVRVYLATHVLCVVCESVCLATCEWLCGVSHRCVCVILSSYLRVIVWCVLSLCVLACVE
jgi:hypothetical protein